MPDYRGALADIERAVDGGNTDLSALGFWRIVRELKAEPALTEQWAEQIGRIDGRVFEARVRPLFPVWLGNLVLLVGTAVGLAAVEIALRLADGRLGGAARPNGGGLVIVAAAAALSVTVHDPAHWFVGRWNGIRFTHYFLDGPFLVQPGIKTDYATYLAVEPAKRAAMHAAGALASKVAPFAVFAWAYTVHWLRGWDLLPAWSVWTVLGFGLAQLATDVIWSTKRSDWKKVRRELRFAARAAADGGGRSDRPRGQA